MSLVRPRTSTWLVAFIVRKSLGTCACTQLVLYCQCPLTGLQCKAEDMMVVEPSEPVTEVFGGEEESAGGSELEEDMVRGLSMNGLC